MRLKKIFLVWSFVTLICFLEYWALKYNTKFSFLIFLQSHLNFFSGKNLNTEVGKTVSYWLGWIGFSIIVLTNPYIIRKRFAFFSRWGKLPNWLTFHILCGLLGPTFIIFHADFRVGGLVAISFWSMMIVAVSGIVGSYFYLQVSAQRNELSREIEYWNKKLGEMRDKYAKDISDEALGKLKKKALRYVGGDITPDEIGLFVLPRIFVRSFICDIKLYFAEPKTLVGLPGKSRIVLGNFALASRKFYLQEPFQRLLAHWHTFHVPFAIMMYVAAIIHIIVALMFGV